MLTLDRSLSTQFKLGVLSLVSPKYPHFLLGISSFARLESSQTVQTLPAGRDGKIKKGDE